MGLGEGEAELPQARQRAWRHCQPRPHCRSLSVIYFLFYFLAAGRTEIVTDDGYCRE